MDTDIVFLLIEYSAIPIILLVYTGIIKRLATNYSNDKESWSYGLELMLIVSVSTLLYGLSFASHSNGQTLSVVKYNCILTCGVIFVIGFAFTIYITGKVREWGESSKKTKINSNLSALAFWVVLVILILKCNSYSSHHHNPVEIPIKPTKDNINMSVQKDNISSISIVGGSNVIVLFATPIIIMSILTLLFWIRIKKIKRNAIANYNNGLQLLKDNPSASISSLEASLRKIPDDNELLIDIYMKLSRLYSENGDKEQALKQINILEKTSAYQELRSYLKSSIIKTKFYLLLEMNKVIEAEKLVDLVGSRQLSDQFKASLFEKSKKGVSNE